MPDQSLSPVTPLVSLLVEMFNLLGMTIIMALEGRA